MNTLLLTLPPLGWCLASRGRCNSLTRGGMASADRPPTSGSLNLLGASSQPPGGASAAKAAKSNGFKGKSTPPNAGGGWGFMLHQGTSYLERVAGSHHVSFGEMDQLAAMATETAASSQAPMLVRSTPPPPAPRSPLRPPALRPAV